MASGEAADRGHRGRHGRVSQKHRGAHAETSQDNDSIGNVATGNPDLENIGTNARDLKATRGCSEAEVQHIVHKVEIVVWSSGGGGDPEINRVQGGGNGTWDRCRVEVEEEMFLEQLPRPAMRASRLPRRAATSPSLKPRPGTRRW